MPIKTIEQFRKICEAWERDIGYTFEEKMFVETDAGASYETIFRDESNWKCEAHLVWIRDTGNVSINASYPEAQDCLNNIVRQFEDPKNRRFTVYAKVEVKAKTLQEAIGKVNARIQHRKDMSGQTFGDARTAQFG
jgi:hypothetical protein